MKLRLMLASVVAVALMFSGCAEQPTVPEKEVSKKLNAPAPAVAKLIKKYNLEVVDFAYTNAKIGIGTRSGAKAILIDARPAAMYAKSTIPSSLNIPDTEFDKYVGQLDKVAKDKEIIVYCGGWECGKSPKVAGMLQAKGFTDVKLYQAGEPEWKTKSYVEVGVPVVEAAFKKNGALLIDARPYAKTLAESIPGALFMNDDDMPKLMGRFPTDKATPIITFCAGYECHKSHVVAHKLQELGYSNVKVFAGGLPAWKAAEMPTTKGAKKEAPKVASPEAVKVVDGIQLGVDDGTVDGEWYKALVVADKVPANVAIVDVRSPEEFANGHLKGAMNLEAAKMSIKDFAAALPKDKVVIFNCATGGRAMEAHMKLNDAKIDVSKIFYFDANIKCDAQNKCEIIVNEPLG
ncbi:MAG: sulfurtransferase [Sulfurospirillum sp.]|nr:sulfurtransferase [Sulfurospirillum sp.]